MRLLFAACGLGLCLVSFAERYTITESLGATDLEIVKVVKVPNSNDFVIGYKDRTDQTAAFIAKANKDGVIWKKRCVASGKNEGNLLDVIVDNSGNVTWHSKAQFDGTQWRSVIQQLIGTTGGLRWTRNHFTTLVNGFRLDQLQLGRNGYLYGVVFTNKFEGREFDPTTGLQSNAFDFGNNVTEVYNFTHSYPDVTAFLKSNGQASYIRYGYPVTQTLLPWITGNTSVEGYFDNASNKNIVIARGDVNSVHEYNINFVEEFVKNFTSPLIKRVDTLFTNAYLTDQEITVYTDYVYSPIETTYSIPDYFVDGTQYRKEGAPYRAIDTVSTNNRTHGQASQLWFRRFASFSDPSYHIAPTHAKVRDEEVESNGQLGKPFIVSSGSARTTILYPKTLDGVNAIEVYTVPTVNPVSLPDSFETNEDVRIVSQDDRIRKNDFDPELLNSLSAELVQNLNPELGSVAIQGGGKTFTFSVKPNANGVATVLYRVRAGDRLGPVTPITVTIHPVNDPPIARADTYTVARGRTLDVGAPGVLANDNDVEGSPLTAQLRSPVTGGTLTFRAYGSFRYVAPATAGTYTFTYRARATDDGLCSPDTTVTINVN